MQKLAENLQSLQSIVLFFWGILPHTREKFSWSTCDLPYLTSQLKKKETDSGAETHHIENLIADFVFTDYAPTLTSPIFAISKSFVISWIYTL